MRKFLLLCAIFISLSAKSQIGYEDYYSEEQLQNNLKQAETAGQRLDAMGSLAEHYKGIHRDSLSNIYFQKVSELVNQTKDNNLIARGLWWKMRYGDDVETADSLFKFAEQHNLVLYRIAANLYLSVFYIHSDLALSEKYILKAKTLLDEWKKDTLLKDSVRLEVYRNAAHVYIHKKDGLNAARYLLALRDNAEQNKRQDLKIQAMEDIGDMYLEWGGQQTKATPWLLKIYDYYQKSGDRNKLLLAAVELSHHYVNIGNNELAKRYLAEVDKLMDSLKAYGLFQYWLLQRKFEAGIITLPLFMRTLDNHFNGHLLLPEKMTVSAKAEIYVYSTSQLDSAGVYLFKAKKMGEDVRNELAYYYMQTKDYDRAIPVIKELKDLQEKGGDIGGMQTQCRRLSRAYAAKEDYKSAYDYLGQFNRLRDSVEKLNDKEEIASMEMEKQLAIQEATAAEQRKSQEAAQSKIEFRNQVRFYSLLAGAAILLIIAGLLWRNNRNKQKAYALLQKQKSKTDEALQELKSTQAQLIQSEKMASLGELTAGIAHEIQNPLNFVNNFSEVNGELINELVDEVDKGNTEEVKAIANDIKDNSEKINHHGKRADAIVKGMLQHSKTSTGKKEPTDINGLCDEYLRLAYHGLRAKDKSFNADFKTDFDETVGKINIVPEDLGRVLLNLYNNAFYAVKEKLTAHGPQLAADYNPIVSVQTKKLNDKIEIKVADNGNGIPQNIVDKIFQPFFTTKPTGQGTGLGLSLSYDIIKAHGGEIKVETKEGEGSEFIIQLPLI